MSFHTDHNLNSNPFQKGKHSASTCVGRNAFHILEDFFEGLGGGGGGRLPSQTIQMIVRREGGAPPE